MPSQLSHFNLAVKYRPPRLTWNISAGYECCHLKDVKLKSHPPSSTVDKAESLL